MRDQAEVEAAGDILRWLVSRAPASPDTLAMETALAALEWAAGGVVGNPLPGVLAAARKVWVECGQPPLPGRPELPAKPPRKRVSV